MMTAQRLSRAMEWIILVILVVSVFVLPRAVHAANTISLGSTTVAPGGNVTIVVNSETDVAFSSLRVSIGFPLPFHSELKPGEGRAIFGQPSGGYSVLPG